MLLLEKPTGLNLSAKVKPRTVENFKKQKIGDGLNDSSKKTRKSRFKSLLIEKDFEPENPKQLEELDENSCKWPSGHPNESSFYFCGRTSLKRFFLLQTTLAVCVSTKRQKRRCH